ncbi:MAG TPA: hypothetical protein VJO53_03935 [Candidatus Acidoferrales bacterium]|nr:hypothetical protein [Candidatus Acidoferrales bacterium]
MIRSVLAVLVGIAVLTITSFAIEAAADPLLMRMFPNALPNSAALSHNLPARLFMMAYTMICVAAGGYVTAWIARRSQVRHAVIMGAVQVVLTVWAMFTLPHQAPLWGWITGMALTVPAAWIGGVIRAKQGSRELQTVQAAPG